MARRAKASRASALSTPTPVASSRTTPLSSAYPSTYTSEAEIDDLVSSLSSSLKLQPRLLPLGTQAVVTAAATKKPRRVPRHPFPFLSLPSELRLKIYGYHFANTGTVIDLDPDNYKRIHQRLAILRVCRTIYVEASHLFYATHPARVFPTHPGRFFKTRKPLLSRLKPRQRGSFSALELRLGPGWNRPPRGWVVNEALGLKECFGVRKLVVFVECDPSDGVFKGFRQADGFYELFSKSLLGEVLAELPSVQVVEFDAWPSVKKSGGMMRGLLEVVALGGYVVRWGPERGWTDAPEEDEETREEKIAIAPASSAISFAGLSAHSVMVLA